MKRTAWVVMWVSLAFLAGLVVGRVNKPVAQSGPSERADESLVLISQPTDGTKRDTRSLKLIRCAVPGQSPVGDQVTDHEAVWVVVIKGVTYFCR